MAGSLAPPAALYGRMRGILEAARANVVRTVNTTQVVANWLVGREIVEAEQGGHRRADYGARLLAALSARLTQDFGRGWSVDNLEAHRQFYLLYPRLISETVSRRSGMTSISETASRKSALPAPEAWQPGELHPALSWSHYRTLLRIRRREARDFYEMERLVSARAWASDGQPAVRATGEEPRQGRPHGAGYARSGGDEAPRRAARSVDGDHFYVDLVFYHTILKCYVLIDLKVGKLTHGDLGQIQFYVSYFDSERRTEGDNPTIGLILCSDKNDAVVRYTLGEQERRNVFASRYQLYLPPVEELQQELVRERRQILPAEPTRSAEKHRTMRKRPKGKQR